MIVTYSEFFQRTLNQLSNSDLKIIFDFVDRVEQNGLTGLPGANRKSDRTFSPDAVDFAHENNLWHYHIGIPKYNTSKGFGKYTSEYYLHYQRFPDKIRLVSLDKHQPFTLPLKKMLEQERA